MLLNILVALRWSQLCINNAELQLVKSRKKALNMEDEYNTQPRRR